jgi:hypothetical protein
MDREEIAIAKVKRIISFRKRNSHPSPWRSHVQTPP